MAKKAARKYELYLPITFNDGRLVPWELIRGVESRLLVRFKGLTSVTTQFPLRGVWQGEKRLYFDKVIILTIFDFRPRGSSTFFSQFKQHLLQEFEQEEILITESPVQVF